MIKRYFNRFVEWYLDRKKFLWFVCAKCDQRILHGECGCARV